MIFEDRYYIVEELRTESFDGVEIVLFNIVDPSTSSSTPSQWIEEQSWSTIALHFR